MATMDPLQTLLAQLRALTEDGLARIETAADTAGVEQLRVELLGKKSELNDLMRRMGSLTPEQKPAAGKALNDAKVALSAGLATKRDAFTRADRDRSLREEKLDVTQPGRPAPRGHLHPITQGLNEITGIFTEMGFEVVSGPDLEDEYHNFEALNIPANHPARDMHDTFYLSGGGVLRTHTSPVQIRSMKTRKPPVAIIAPGRVYRCDDDQTHSPMFTQMEGLLVDEDIHMSDLKGVLERLIHRYFGEGRPYRMRPSFFPFTEPSTEVDILWRKDDGSEQWLEVLGAGMVHPAVLENVGYDSRKVSGFAFGLGVERFVMLKYGISNIHLFYENDLRFLRQF
jgi:phenylalanyl-tRNA synthetase alpha chain